MSNWQSAGADLLDLGRDLPATSVGILAHGSDLKRERLLVVGRDAGVQCHSRPSRSLIFHNLCSLTRLVQDLEQRGETVPEDALAAISPYLTEHINRFGDYTLNLARKPPQADYGYTLRRAASNA